MEPDRSCDRLGGSLAEPGFEDPLDGAPVKPGTSSEEFVPAIRTHALDRGATPARRTGFHADAMELAAVVDEAAVPRATEGGHLRALSFESAEVAEDPGLPLADEAIDAPVHSGPAAAGRRWERDDQAAPGVDGQAQAARTGRPPDDEVDRGLAEHEGVGGLEDRRGSGADHPARMVTGGRRGVGRETAGVAPCARYAGGSARFPVPFATSGTPLAQRTLRPAFLREAQGGPCRAWGRSDARWAG